MKEYIMLEEEKARRRGKVYNWETATYGKIWYDEDFHDLRSVETKFPAIVLNDALTSEVTLSSECYFDDLDFFKDFEKEFPAIVYNDALPSKLYFLTEPTRIQTPQIWRIDLMYVIQSLFFNTVNTAYSLNEYSIFDTDGKAMINSIQNGDQPLPVITQVSLAGNAQNVPPTLKDLKF
nr:hypothetical protein [Tanacetum cinerariifolium]